MRTKRPAAITALLLPLLATTGGAAIPPCTGSCGMPATRPGQPIAVGDLDGDGRPDLVTQATTGTMDRAIWLSGPSGLPATPSVAVTSAVVMDGGLAEATGDLDGDGIGDLVLAQRSAPTQVWVLFGVSAWPSTVALGGPSSRTLLITGLPRLTSASLTGGISVAVGDLDGDGRADLAIGIGRSDSAGVAPDTIDVLRGPLAPGSQDLSAAPATLRILLPPLAHWNGGQAADGLACGDVTGDGVGDLVFGAHLATAAGSVPAGSSVRVVAGPLPTGLLDLRNAAPTVALVAPLTDLLGASLTLADVNGDGDLDVIAGAPGEGPAGTVAIAFGPLGAGVLDVTNTALPRVSWVRGVSGSTLVAGLAGGSVDGSPALLVQNGGVMSSGFALVPPPGLASGVVDLGLDPLGACALDASPVLAGDFDGNGRPSTVMTSGGQWWLLDQAGGVDTTPPTLSIAQAPTELWPPDHRLVPFRLGSDVLVNVSDACDPAPVVRFVGATSSEPERGRGAGNTAPDVIVQDDIVWLRAEREGVGRGRTYTVTIAATDASGNEATTTFDVLVAHDRLLGPLPPRRRSHGGP